MSVEMIIGSTLGAALAAFFGIGQALLLHRLERNRKVRSLIAALEGELAVIGELANVDLDLTHIQTMEEGLERVHRVEVARQVFEGAAGQLGILPGNLAAAVVRCYGRLAAKTEAMRRLLEMGNFFTFAGDRRVNARAREQYGEHQKLIATEVDILLDDLRKYRS